MEKLNFPVFKGALPGPPPHTSMEEYLVFIQFCMEHFYDQKRDDYWREKRRVDVPFRLK